MSGSASRLKVGIVFASLCISSVTDRDVLSVFKKLHRTRQNTFAGDTASLAVVRDKINEEFRKHVDVQEPEKISELIGVAVEAEETLRKNVIQAKKDEDSGHFKLRITDDTEFYDNVMFDPSAELPKGRRRKKCDDPPSS